jgi:hypothetical protein
MATKNDANDGAQTHTPSEGYRGRQRSTERNRVVGPDGRRLDPRTDLANHSPTGLEWGYGGSGPAQLALALLADRYPDGAALAHYQWFKNDVVAGLDGDDWTLPVDAVDEFLTDEQVADATPSTEISGPHNEVIGGEETGATFWRCENCGLESMSEDIRYNGCPCCDGSEDA